MSEGMKEIAPGVHVPAGARRVLKSGDPRGDDYREAGKWVADIRHRLVEIRGELEDIGRIEAISEHDRLCVDVAGTMSLALITLNILISGERSFFLRADRLDELWQDVAAHPEQYVIEDGTTLAKRAQKEEQPWEWKPWDIFKRGGNAAKLQDQVETLEKALSECRRCASNERAVYSIANRALGDE